MGNKNSCQTCEIKQFDSYEGFQPGTLMNQTAKKMGQDAPSTPMSPTEVLHLAIKDYQNVRVQDRVNYSANNQTYDDKRKNCSEDKNSESTSSNYCSVDKQNSIQINLSMYSNDKRARLPRQPDGMNYNFKDQGKIKCGPSGLQSMTSSQIEKSSIGKYEGDMVNMQRHGFGLQQWSLNSYYEGQWYNNEIQGRGTQLYNDGSVFIGKWRSNRANGEGIFFKRLGSKWVGQWQSDLLVGIGLEINNDFTFEGYFNQGLKEGHGKCQWNDGSFYKGYWFDDRIEGFGVYTWADGRQYQGDWIANMMQGKGILNSKNGTVYQGDFENDTKHGYGILLNPNGTKIEGTWLSGKLEGLAIISQNNSEIRQLQQFKNGDKIKTYTSCHVKSILQGDWQRPQKYVKEMTKEMDKVFLSFQVEIKRLYNLEKSEKDFLLSKQIKI